MTMTDKQPGDQPKNQPDKRDQVRQVGDAVVHRWHELEHSAADAYHALDDHSPRELLQDVKQLLSRFAAWLMPHIAQFKAWYLAQNTVLKVVYGLTLVPVVAVLAFLGVLLIKFGGPVILATALAAKLAVVAVKSLFFIGYIFYKIVKTVLMWYITISRLYTGNKAKKVRHNKALCCDFDVKPAAMAERLKYHCDRKKLVISEPKQGQLTILFSYLRYAIRGQLELLRHLRRRWPHYLTPWRSTSGALIKQELAPVGTSMFSPHQLGAVIDKGQILVPGDAELTLIDVQADGVVWLHFLIRWVEWHFNWHKAFPFLTIRRDHQQASWQVEGRLQAETTS
jgi:hypothetical protein